MVNDVAQIFLATLEEEEMDMIGFGIDLHRWAIQAMKGAAKVIMQARPMIVV